YAVSAVNAGRLFIAASTFARFWALFTTTGWSNPIFASRCFTECWSEFCSFGDWPLGSASPKRRQLRTRFLCAPHDAWFLSVSRACLLHVFIERWARRSGEKPVAQIPAPRSAAPESKIQFPLAVPCRTIRPETRSGTRFPPASPDP